MNAILYSLQEERKEIHKLGRTIGMVAKLEKWHKRARRKDWLRIIVDIAELGVTGIWSCIQSIMQSYVMNSTYLYSICGTFATHVMALSVLTLDPFGLLSPG